MKQKSKISIAVAIVGVLLIAPALFSVLGYLIGSVATLLALNDADPAERQSLINASFKVLGETQLYLAIAIIPGIIACSISGLYFKAGFSWFSKTLKIFSYLLMPVLPIITLFGIYLFILSNKIKQNA